MTSLVARRLAPLALALVAADAHAQDGIVVLGQSLALAGLVGGLIAGGLAAFKPEDVRFGGSFGVYLGVLCAGASTWAGSLEIVPLTLVIGAAAGILPYAAAFFAVRRAIVWLRSRRQAARPPE